MLFTMCRLFGLLADPVVPAEPWLVASERSLLRQANVTPEAAQRDGWGIAWYDSQRRAHVDKGVRGAAETSERDRFLKSAQHAEGSVVIGHLRRASNPMKLPHDRLIALENSQPFQYENYLFAHNGSIPLPRETRPLLGPLEPQVRGVNDSEVLFWLLVRHVEATHDPLQAYARAVADLEQVWMDHGRPKEGPYTGLNVLFSTGPSELWAFCSWLGDHGKSLIDKTRPYFQLVYSADTKQLVVGSEPFDENSQRWLSLDNHQFLHAQAGQGLVGITVGDIPMPPRIAALSH
jgi:predicted glutamine amidotransferase